MDRAQQAAGRPARIVLAGVNSQFVHSALAPWCLRAGLLEYARTPLDVSVVEGTVNEPREHLLRRILDENPDILGISCYIWNIACVEGLLPRLREALPGCVIVLGGPEVSHNAGEVLARCPAADYVISGEGEQPFAALVDALHGRGDFAAVEGLCRRDEEGYLLSAPHIHQQMQPSPYGPAYLDALDGRIAYLETSRGCPYACAFCLSGRGEGLRQAPLERAFLDILLLANSGSSNIKLVDRTFNADRARALQILRFIAGEVGRGIPQGLTFHFEIAGDLLDEATLGFLEGAPPGLFQFEIGLQSMDEATLRLVRRRTDMALLTRQVGRLIAMGRAHVHLDLIAGLPGEDLEAFAAGFDAAYALRPQALQLGFLKLIHGSAMREQPEHYPCAFDAAPPYQVSATPWLSAADFEVLRLAERGLDKLHNTGRFQSTLHWLTTTGGLRPFALFLPLGRLIVEAEKGTSLPLDALTDLVAGYLFEHHQGQAPLLRDLLVRDRLAAVRNTVLPRSLKCRDARFHQVKRALDSLHPRPGQAPRAIAFLYAGAGDRVLWCDYDKRDPVTGLYALHERAVDEVLRCDA